MRGVAVTIFGILGVSVLAIGFGGVSFSLFGISIGAQEESTVSEQSTSIGTSPHQQSTSTYTPQAEASSGYSSQAVSSVNAQVSSLLPLIEVSYSDYLSYGDVSGYQLEQKKAILDEIIDNIETLSANKELLSTYSSNNPNFVRAADYIEMLPELKAERDAL